MHSAGNLAALLHLRRIAHIDHQRVAFRDHLARLSRCDLWHRGVGGLHHLLDVCCHFVRLPVCITSNGLGQSLPYESYAYSRMSDVSHSLPTHFASRPTFVRCYSNSEQTRVWLDCPLSAISDHQHKWETPVSAVCNGIILQCGAIAQNQAMSLIDSAGLF